MPLTCPPRLAVAAAALAAALAAAALPAPPARAAGIPVLDAANLAQNVRIAIEAVAQTLRQIEQYRTQLQQYETQLRNTVAPAAWLWDRAQASIAGLLAAVDTLRYYKASLGSTDAFLARFQSVAYYRASPCFAAGGCTARERALLEENRRLASDAQKRANDALLRGLDRQQEALAADARRLEQLQGGVQGARGQMEAIQFANQLASQQAAQLLQIRGLMIAQHNALAARMQAEADREALEAAAAEQARAGSYRLSPPRAW